MKCESKVLDGLVLYSCQHAATVKRNGKSYCTIHDPQRKEKQRAAWDAAFERHNKALDLVYQLEDEVVQRGRKEFPDLYARLDAARRAEAQAKGEMRDSHRKAPK